MENNEREFARIVRENKRRIYTVCYMFSKDTEQVNDLFQDILINIWNGLKSFEGDKYLSTWIWKVSLNTCINYSKKKKKEVPTQPLDVSFNLYEDTDDDSMQIQQLYKRINKLGFIDRSIILMWLENMSYEEIGAILGITANNVSVKLVRIREKLKQM
jgi:RNA polymerase sigma-70 factor (ECF subfamily)